MDHSSADRRTGLDRRSAPTSAWQSALSGGRRALVRRTPRTYRSARYLRYPSRTLMNHQTPFLVALGMLTAAAFVVGVTGWILFARDHAARKLGMSAGSVGSGEASAGSTVSLGTSATEASASEAPAAVSTSVPSDTPDHHHEVAEGS